MSERAPEIAQETIFHLVVCVPEDWTDEAIELFARKHPCGTQGGWARDRDEHPDRYPCDGREGCVHVVFAA